MVDLAVQPGDVAVGLASDGIGVVGHVAFVAQQRGARESGRAARPAVQPCGCRCGHGGVGNASGVVAHDIDRAPVAGGAIGRVGGPVLAGHHAACLGRNGSHGGRKDAVAALGSVEREDRIEAGRGREVQGQVANVGALIAQPAASLAVGVLAVVAVMPGLDAGRQPIFPSTNTDTGCGASWRSAEMPRTTGRSAVRPKSGE